MKKAAFHRLFRAIEFALLAALLSACATSVEKKEEQSGGAVHALNYSAREVAYIAVEHPGHPEGGGGGDALNPYGSGGDICCFSVPAKWSPDIKVVIVYQFYPEKAYRRVEVGVPPYPNGKAGDIWLIVHPDESVEAVVSDFGPSLPEWPGAIKGYPAPSREYRVKRWEEKVQSANAYIKDGERRKISSSYSSYTDVEKETLEKNIEYFKAQVDYLLKNKP